MMERNSPHGRLLLWVCIALIAFGISMFSGCALIEPRRVTDTVSVEVPIPCVVDVPPKPELLSSGTWTKTPNVYERVRALLIDRSRLIAHTDTLTTLLLTCKGKPAP